MKKLALIALALTAPIHAQTPATKTMTEYVVPSLNYYFLTSRDNEKTLLDANPAFRRTGYSFTVLATPVAGSAGITRYYFDQIAKAGTRGSHFYTLVATEVAALNALNPANTTTPRLPQNEGIDSYAYPAAEDDPIICDVDKEPVYRVFRGNSRFPDDANHRFTTDRALYLQLLAEGWEDEGVKFCAFGRTLTVPPSNGDGGDTYKGTFRITGSNPPGQLTPYATATGTVTYKQIGPDDPFYIPGNWGVRYFRPVEGSITQSVDYGPEVPCGTTTKSIVPTTLPVKTGFLAPFMELFDATGANGIAAPREYDLAAEFVGQVSVVYITAACGSSPRKELAGSTGPLGFVTGCNARSGPTYTDVSRLSGSVNCGNGRTLSWDFQRQ